MKIKSLRQVAKELEVSPSYLSQVLNNKRSASDRLLSASSFRALSNVKHRMLATNPDTDTASGQIRTDDRRFTKLV
jgi:transcriptional regulator with XRE-family HTH domain